MTLSGNSRRLFIKNSALSILAVPFAQGWTSSSKLDEIDITLLGRANDLADEIVSFGLPLPFGFLHEPANLKVLDEHGNEVTCAVRALEPWHIGGKEGSLRSVLVQFNSDFSHQKTKQIKVRFHQRRQKNEKRFSPVQKTLIDDDGLKGPRVAAVLPATWLCRSEIVGPQTPVTASGSYSPYDEFVGKNFPGSLAY